jgi:hypothetical protein
MPVDPLTAVWPKVPPDEPMLQFFIYRKVTMPPIEITKPFADLAISLVKALERSPERTVMLRKLVEARDCAIRAYLSQSHE